MKKYTIVQNSKKDGARLVSELETSKARAIKPETNQNTKMKNIANIASAGEQAIITGHYGLDKSKLTETPERINEVSSQETEIILKSGTRVTIYDAVEPLVELPGAWEAEEEEA